MCQQATNAYLKLGDIAEAVNTCVYLNQWNTAIQLAETHHFKEIEKLLSRYGEYILKQDHKKEAIELYRKANYCQQSAKLLLQCAQDAIKNGSAPVPIKKLFVLGALEIERYHSIQRSLKNNVLFAN